MREFVGKVVSNRMTKSVLVAVERLKEIPKYKARVKWTKKFMAHDEENECNMGDIVRIHLCRPLSKRKSFTVTEIIRREKVYNPQEAAEKARKVIEEHKAAKLQREAQKISKGFAAAPVAGQ